MGFRDAKAAAPKLEAGSFPDVGLESGGSILDLVEGLRIFGSFPDVGFQKKKQPRHRLSLLQHTCIDV